MQLHVIAQFLNPMNYDRINLLSNYSPAESDWGIEETFPPRNRFNSATISELSQPPPIPYHEFGHLSPSISTGHYGLLSDQDLFPHVHLKSTLQPNTENFHKYINVYLSFHEKNSQIVEEFRYNLVVSNLLDDTLVLSKNEQALNNLVQIKGSVDVSMQARLAKEFNFDGSELQVVNKHYRLIVPKVYRNSIVLLRTICLIVFLMKQNLKVRSKMLHTAKVKLFKILLIVATKVMKYKRATSMIQASRGLRALDDFMISNCEINKALISNMITIREFDMFIFLNKTDSEANPVYSKDLKLHLSTILSCLTLNVRHSISRLLPLSNGEILEKYCLINNIQLGPIFAGPDSGENDEITLDELTKELNYFNNLRRFFICQLLNIHNDPIQNFFILKLYDSFNLHPHTSNTHSTANRLHILERVLSEHTSALDQIMALNDKFKGLYNAAQANNHANDNVLTQSSYGIERRDEVFAPETELNLTNLINKLQNLSTSLIYFKKYSQSISEINDAEEYDEKLSIFKLFNSELKASLDLYKACISEYQAEFSKKFVLPSSTPSSQSNSRRNSYNCNDQFSLKSFHTSSSVKKRIFPVHGLENRKDLRSITSKSNDRKSKRMPTGLQLGLLTVLEEPQESRLGPAKDTEAVYDDFTLSSNDDSFNQSALGALTSKIGIRPPNDRFSVNSLTSNISGMSDLIASTQITTDVDETDRSRAYLLSGLTQGMSKEDLKMKLEESFSRIYSLENENQELRSKNKGEGTRDCFKEELDQTEIDFDSARNVDFADVLRRILEIGNT